MIEHSAAERRVLSAVQGRSRVEAEFDGEQRIRGSVLAEALTGAEALRSVRITGARIDGRVDLAAARLDFPIELRDCHFDDDLVLTEAQVASIRLPGCRIPTLEATQLHVAGNVELDGARCGPVVLDGARIGGRFRFEHARLTASGEPALRANRVQVEQGIFGQKSIVDGGLVLNHARVGGPVALNESHLSGPSWALKANGLACTAHLGLQGAVARGSVRMLGARIGGSLVLLNTTLHNPEDWALLLIDVEAGLVTLRPAADSAGTISLRDARFKSITDDPPNWPENCRIELTGLTYQRLTRRSTDLAPCPISTRLEWMKRCSTTADRQGFSPAPYTQLAAALRADGMDREAREVQRFKERHRHRNQGPLGVLWGALQDATFGFGYRPVLALTWVAALLCAGTAHFALSGPLRAIKKDESPTWDPFLYSLDLLVPLVDLGHEKAWDPTGWHKAVALALIVGGWILVTAVVAGAGRVLNRNAP